MLLPSLPRLPSKTLPALRDRVQVMTDAPCLHRTHEPSGAWQCPAYVAGSSSTQNVPSEEASAQASCAARELQPATHHTQRPQLALIALHRANCVIRTVYPTLQPLEQQGGSDGADGSDRPLCCKSSWRQEARASIRPALALLPTCDTAFHFGLADTLPAPQRGIHTTKADPAPGSDLRHGDELQASVRLRGGGTADRGNGGEPAAQGLRAGNSQPPTSSVHPTAVEVHWPAHEA